MQSAIIRVSYFYSQPVQCCDRCSQGIAHVFVVTYRDGLKAKFGSECINKILAGDTSLKSLFNKNAKLLKKYQGFLAALEMPESEMPRGREYFGSGLYFVADANGDDVFIGHWFFHPIFDADKNAAVGKYVQTDANKYALDCRAAIDSGKADLKKEIERIELFLARVIAKAQAVTR